MAKARSTTIIQYIIYFQGKILIPSIIPMHGIKIQLSYEVIGCVHPVVFPKIMNMSSTENDPLKSLISDIFRLGSRNVISWQEDGLYTTSKIIDPNGIVLLLLVQKYSFGEIG